MTTALAATITMPARLGSGWGNSPDRLAPEWRTTYAANRKKVSPMRRCALRSAASASSPSLSAVSRHTNTPPANSSMMLSSPNARMATLPAWSPAHRATAASTRFHARPATTRMRAVLRRARDSSVMEALTCPLGTLPRRGRADRKLPDSNLPNGFTRSGDSGRTDAPSV